MLRRRSTETMIDEIARAGALDGVTLSLLPGDDGDDKPRGGNEEDESDGRRGGGDAQDQPPVFDGIDGPIGDTGTLSAWPRDAEGMRMEMDLDDDMGMEIGEYDDAKLRQELATLMAGPAEVCAELVSPPAVGPSEPSDVLSPPPKLPPHSPPKLPPSTPSNPLQRLLAMPAAKPVRKATSKATTRSIAVGAGLFFSPNLYVLSKSRPISREALSALVMEHGDMPHLKRKRKRPVPPSGIGRRVRSVRAA